MKKYSFVEELYDPVSSTMIGARTKQMSRRGSEHFGKSGRTWIGTPVGAVTGALGAGVGAGLGALVGKKLGVGRGQAAGVGAIIGGALGANKGRNAGQAVGKGIGAGVGAAYGAASAAFQTKGQRLSAETYENERTLSNPNATQHQKHVAAARLQRARAAQQNLANYYDAISKTPDPQEREEIRKQFQARSRHLNDIYGAHKQMG